jgi:hypothetical protein
MTSIVIFLDSISIATRIYRVNTRNYVYSSEISINFSWILTKIYLLVNMSEVRCHTFDRISHGSFGNT